MKETTEKSVTLDGNDVSSVRSFLRFMYPPLGRSCQPELEFESIQGVMELAEEYQVAALQQKCQVYLKTKLEACASTPIGASHVIKIVALAARFSIGELHTQAKEKMKSSQMFRHLIANPDFYKQDPQWVQELVMGRFKAVEEAVKAVRSNLHHRYVVSGHADALRLLDNRVRAAGMSTI